jgi:hypothetical protein
MMDEIQKPVIPNNALVFCIQVGTLTICDLSCCYSGASLVEDRLPSEVIIPHFVLAFLGGGTTI